MRKRRMKTVRREEKKVAEGEVAFGPLRSAFRGQR